IKDGDIINVDITTFYNGFHGDTSATFYIRTPSKEARHVVEVARRALQLGIAEVKDGARLGDIGAAIQEYVEAQGCSVVRDFVGHGIGRRFHEDPQLKPYGRRWRSVRRGSVGKPRGPARSRRELKDGKHLQERADGEPRSLRGGDRSRR